QVMHSRRRRTWLPCATSRESMTLVSTALQKGQCMVLLYFLSGVNREALAQCNHFGFHCFDHCFVGVVFQNVTDPVGQISDFLLTEAATGGRRGADTQAAGDEWRTWVVRNRILVHGYV